MTDWYHRQFGDAETFAVSVALGRDPHPTGDPARDILWGAFELWVRGKCLTRSATADTANSAVRWSLLPVIEWMLDVGIVLVNEDPFPLVPKGRQIGDACDWYDACEWPAVIDPAAEERWFARRSVWRRHHALRRADEGACLPNVLFRRLGDAMEVSWDNESWSSGRPDLRFVEVRGRQHVPAQECANVLRDAAQDVLARALERASGVPELLALQARGHALEAAADDWMLLVHEQTAAAIRSELADLAAELTRATGARKRGWYVPHSVETELLRQVSLARAAEIRAVLEAGACLPGAPMAAQLRDLVRPSAPARSRPWKDGNERAEEVRERLGWGVKPVPPLSDWLTERGVFVRQDDGALPASVALLTHRADDGRAAAHVNPSFDPVRRRETAIATALGHLLMDDGRVTVDGVAEHWPSAARARAFGVALTLPEDGVRAVLGGAKAVGREHVDELVGLYGAGRHATTWRLANLGLITESERHDLAQPG